MDHAAQEAIHACGTCGRPEREHQFARPGQAGSDEALILFALGGGGPNGAACTNFVISEAALRYQKHLNIANGRAGRKPGPRCTRCALRGHTKENCPL